VFQQATQPLVDVPQAGTGTAAQAGLVELMLLIGEVESECRYGRHIKCDVLRKRIAGDTTLFI
jgi:hypothetical protein